MAGTARRESPAGQNTPDEAEWVFSGNRGMHFAADSQIHELYLRVQKLIDFFY